MLLGVVIYNFVKIKITIYVILGLALAEGVIEVVGVRVSCIMGFRGSDE